MINCTIKSELPGNIYFGESVNNHMGINSQNIEPQVERADNIHLCKRMALRGGM